MIGKLPERLQGRIQPHETGCWLWTGELNRNGYGRVHFGGRRVMVHRLVYTLLVGEIPTGLVLDHVRARGCSHRNCCNPAHLEPVTVKVNTDRGEGVKYQFRSRVLAGTDRA